MKTKVQIVWRRISPLCRFIAIGGLLVFAFGCGENTAPVIEELIIPETVESGRTVEFHVVAHDVEGDALTYTWRVDNHTLSATTPTVTWSVPNVDGTFIVEEMNR